MKKKIIMLEGTLEGARKGESYKGVEIKDDTIILRDYDEFNDERTRINLTKEQLVKIVENL